MKFGKTPPLSGFTFYHIYFAQLPNIIFVVITKRDWNILTLQGEFSNIILWNCNQIYGMR